MVPKATDPLPDIFSFVLPDPLHHLQQWTGSSFYKMYALLYNSTIKESFFKKDFHGLSIVYSEHLRMPGIVSVPK